MRRDPHALRRLLLETFRAELEHWLILPCCLFTALWMPAAGVLVNVVFAMAFNLPGCCCSATTAVACNAW